MESTGALALGSWSCSCRLALGQWCPHSEVVDVVGLLLATQVVSVFRALAYPPGWAGGLHILLLNNKKYPPLPSPGP